jgi:hypothetical protein
MVPPLSGMLLLVVLFIVSPFMFGCIFRAVVGYGVVGDVGVGVCILVS